MEKRNWKMERRANCTAQPDSAESRGISRAGMSFSIFYFPFSIFILLP